MQTCDKQMLKISRQYLDLPKSYDHLTENLAQQMAYFSREAVNVVKGWPFVITNFWLISDYTNMDQDICLKFSAFVHHMSVLN